jgi:hypothetical protein
MTHINGRVRYIHCVGVEETTEDFRVKITMHDRVSGVRNLIEIFEKSEWAIKRDLRSELDFARKEIERLKQFQPRVVATAEVAPVEAPFEPRKTSGRAVDPKPLIGMDEKDNEDRVKELIGDPLDTRKGEYNAMDPKNWEQPIELTIDPKMMVEKEFAVREIENKAKQRRARAQLQLSPEKAGAGFTPDWS